MKSMKTNAIKALRAQFEAKLAEARELSEKEDASAEDFKTAERLVEEANELKSTIEAGIETAQKMAALQSWDSEPVTGVPEQAKPENSAPVGKTTIDLMTGEVVSETGAGVLSGAQMKAVTNPDYLKAYLPFLRAGGRIENVRDADARKFLSEGIDVDGGFLVPPEMLSRMISRDPAPTRIVDLVQTVTVSSDKAKMLRSNYNADDLYSSAVRVYKTAEGAATPKSDKPAFGTLEIDVHSFTAELSVTRELLEDTAFDILGYISEQFRIAYRNHCAEKILLGSGVGEHFGILTRAGKANGPDIVKSGDASALTFAGLQKLKFAVPEQYDQNARYVFNKRSTGLAIASMVDKDDRPLWPVQQQAGMVNGEPANLFGYGYSYEAFMPDVSAGALPIVFGDLNGYIRAARLGMTIEPLREIEARRGQVVFLARFREGGDVAEPWRLKVQKIAAA